MRARINFISWTALVTCGCFAWCFVDLRDMDEMRWDKRASPSWRWSLRSSTCWLAHKSNEGSSVLYRAWITCCLQRWGLRIDCYLSLSVFPMQGDPSETWVIDWWKSYERVVSSIAWLSLTQRWQVFCFKLGFRFQDVCSWWLIKLAWWWVAALRNLLPLVKEYTLSSSWQNVNAPVSLWIHSDPSQREFFLRRNSSSEKPSVRGGSSSSLWISIQEAE